MRAANIWHEEEARDVLYVGDHPHIKGKRGYHRFDVYNEVELFKPIFSHDGEEPQWYRVKLENLVNV